MALYFKAFHIIAFVAWFSGLFYLFRMFVYYAEAELKADPEKEILKKQFLLMQKRVFKIIAEPAMNITWICGGAIIYFYGMEWFKVNTWFHIKLVFLLGLTGFHYYSGRIIKRHERNESTFDSQKFRMLNEIPTLFLLCIVLLAVLKDVKKFGMAIPAIICFAALLYFGVKFYKKLRERNPNI